MNTKRDLQKVYDNISQEFSASRIFPWEELQVFIPQIEDNFKVLDIGCGNGRLLKLLTDSGRHFDYLGVDFSRGLIEQAQRDWPGYKFMVKDMMELDFAPESFDMITMIASFHHIDNKPERQKMLHNIYTWLKPGGYLFMTNWNLLQKKYLQYILKNFWHKRAWNDFFIPWQKYSEDESKLWRYYHSFTPYELEKLLRKAGFAMEPKGVYRTKWNINAFVSKSK